MTIEFKKIKMKDVKEITFKKDVFDRCYVVCIDKDNQVWNFSPDEILKIIPD